MRKILFLSLVFSLFIVIIGLSRSIYELWRKQDLLISYQKQLENQKKQNQTLSFKLSQAQDPNFLEQQARDNLFLVKPGEHGVLLSKDLIIGSSSAKPIEDNRSNLHKWWSLFF